MEFTLKQIAEYTGGKLFGNGEVKVNAFFTDSREAKENMMFLPIVGERVDAHKFIPTLKEKGCIATFSEKPLDEKALGINYILIEKSVLALQKLAKNFRSTLNIPLIGITGSVGKTTTKEMIALALESSLRVHKTLGNANSQIGLPRTVLAIEKESEAAVLEMGMSMPGEMGRLSDTARPNIAVITNIGVSHIEFHGTKENIMKEKLHIADFVPEKGAILVNGDDELLNKLKGKNIFTFGVDEGCDYKATDIKEENGETSFICTFSGKEIPVTIPTLGIHNVRNALVSIAVADKLNLDTEKAAKALSSYKAPDMRQQIKKYGEITVIDDSYNASPDSVKASLDILSSFKGRKIAILADMLELGDYSPIGHNEVGTYAKERGIDILFALGTEAKEIYKGFGDADNSRHFDKIEDINEIIGSFIKAGDTLLIKGSRGMHTDLIVKKIDEILS
ncbi:MAG: UDP-N-acetylmuramoyl-tripeptide--D-alanyl-D-alanine ligase [Clostridia bacterium]|nr:UDP-N-acetylmuramoyl-tripeptide--D-alanyl-D-alanine ligase [Clostridia bacterium]